MGNQNKKNRISTLYFSKLLHTGCPRKSNHNRNPSVRTLNFSKLLYIRCSGKDVITFARSRSTWNFKKVTFTHSIWVNHFERIVVNLTRKTRIKRLYIFKMLYTGCSPRNKQHHCFFWGTRKKLKNKWVLYVQFG